MNKVLEPVHEPEYDKPAPVPVMKCSHCGLMCSYRVTVTGLICGNCGYDPQPVPVPIKPTPIDAPICGCPAGKSDYVRRLPDGKVVREIIVTGYLPCEMRALLNDGTDRECGVADYVKSAKAARIVDGKLYVDCFTLPDGSRAHYAGSKQPSSSSPLVKGQGVPVGGGLLRLYFEGRK